MHKPENVQLSVADVDVDLFKQGKNYYEQKKFDLAFQCFEKSLPAWVDEICESPELPENLFFYAISAINCGYTDKREICVDYLLRARTHFSLAANYNPTIIFFSSYYLGALANQSESEEELASQYFEGALSFLKIFSPQQLRLSNNEHLAYQLNILFCLAELFFTLKKYDKTLEILSQIRGLRSEEELQNNFRFNYIKITLFDGLIKFYSGDYDKAIEVLLAINQLSYNVSGQLTITEQDNDELHYINQAIFTIGQCYFKKKLDNRVVQALSLIPNVSTSMTFTEYTPRENGIYRDYLLAKAHYRQNNIQETYNTIKSALTKVRSLEEINKSLYLEVLYFASKVVDQYNKKSSEGSQVTEIFDLETPTKLLEDCLSVSSIDPVKNAKIHLLLGEDSCLIGQYPTALQYLSVAYNFYKDRVLPTETTKETLLYARTLLALGISENALKQFELGKFYLGKAKEVNQGEIAGLYFTMENFLQLGKCCNALGEYSEAATHLHSCMAVLGKLGLKEKENKIVMAAVCQQLGLSLCRQNLFEKASSFLEASLVVFKENNDELEIASSSIGLALCHYQLKNIEKSNEFSQEALRIIRTIRKEDPKNFDYRYLPVLKCWLSGYTYDKGMGSIASFLNIIRMKETEDILKSLHRNQQPHHPHAHVPPENLKLYNQLKKISELNDEQLSIIARFDEDVIKYYIKNYNVSRKKSSLIINFISALQAHYDNTGVLAPPTLLLKNNYTNLILKFDNKTKLLVENPDSVWIKNFETDEITGADYRTLTELNGLSNEMIEEIINIWHGDQTRNKFSSDDFTLLKFIVENELRARPGHNTLTLVKEIRELQSELDNKTRDLYRFYQSDVDKKLKMNDSQLFPQMLLKIWNELLTANSLNNKCGRADNLLRCLFIHWQQTNAVTTPYLFIMLKKENLSFSTIKINLNLSYILYNCADASWLKAVTFAEIEGMHSNTFKVMVNELTSEEIIEIIAMWRTERPLEPFAPHAKDYELFKLKLLVNKNLEEIEQKLKIRLQEVKDKLTQFKQPMNANTNQKHVAYLKKEGFLNKRKASEVIPQEKPVFKREKPSFNGI